MRKSKATKDSKMNMTEPLNAYLSAIEARDVNILTPLVDEAVILLMPNGKLWIGREAFNALHTEWFKDTDWSWQTNLMAANRWPTGINYLLLIKYKDLNHAGDAIAFSYYLGLTFKQTEAGWLLTFDQNSSVKE